MQVEIERLIETYAKKYNVSKRDAELMFKAPYKMMSDNSKKIDFKEESTLNVNTYLMFMGTFYINKNRYHKIKKEINEAINKSTK